MEKISCSIAKDLMPLYMDGVLSEETTEVMKDHLEGCENCRNEYEIMEQEWYLPSTVKLQEENKKMLKELKSQIKRKRILTGVVAVFLAAMVFASGYLVYENVGAVHEYFSPSFEVSLRDIDTVGEWEKISVGEDGYLNFDSVFYKKEMVVHADSSSGIALRIRDREGNMILESEEILPGESIELEELHRNTDYQVEIKAKGEAVFLWFV